jgi:Flp pilus assembly protein TadD
MMTKRRWKVWLGRAVLVVAGPVGVFAGLEGVLFLTGKFEPVEVVKQVEHEGGRYWVMEPEFTRRVLGRDNVITHQKFFLPVEREAGTRRVLLVGESAAAGYPLTEYGLGRLMRVLWEMRFPGERLEVVDMTSVGVNSHVLRVFVREGLRTNPDAVVLYAGNNEVIGPYGAANVFGRQGAGVWWARAGLAFSNTRTGRAAGMLMERGGGGGESLWRGLNEFEGMALDWEDAGVVRAGEQARENFRAMAGMALEAGSKVLVCVPAVNLTDWPPTGEEAGEAYARGRELQGAGRLAEAWDFYRRACDWDGLRLRADSRVRGAQREVVAERGSGDVMLVDADIWLHEGNAGFETDREFFLEHVHLTFEGRVAVAALMVDGLAELLGTGTGDWVDAQGWWEGFPVRVEAARERVMFTELEEGAMREIVARLLEMEVFAGLADGEERRAREAGRVEDLKSAGAGWKDAGVVREAYARARAAWGGDAELHDTAYKHFGPAGDLVAAREALERAVAARPNLVMANLSLAELAMEEGRREDAWRIVQRAEGFETGGTELDGVLGALLAGRGETKEAVRVLERHVRRRPEDARAVGMLASLWDYSGDSVRAEQLYRVAVELRPDWGGDLNNLAWLLATKDGGTRAERAEAVALARRAVGLNAKAHRFRGTLAVALLADGRVEEGRTEAERAMAMAREAGDEEAVRELEERRAGREN